MLKFSWTAWVVATVWISMRPALAELSAESRAELERYKAALLKADAAWANTYVRGTRTVMTSRTGSPERRQTRSLTIARNGEKILVRMGPVDRGPRPGEASAGESLDIMVPPMIYSLQNHEPGGAFYATNIERVNPRSGYSLDYYNYTFLDAPHALAEVPIRRLLDSPGFTVNSIEHDGERRKISFSGTLSDSDPLRTTGWFLVDPDRGWSVVEYEFRGQAPRSAKPQDVFIQSSTTRGSVRYGPPVDGRSRPEHVELKVDSILSNKILFSSSQLFDIEEYQWKVVPEREFTLEYYGLGDLARPVGSRNHLLFILIAIAVLATIASVVLRRLYRRTQDRTRAT